METKNTQTRSKKMKRKGIKIAGHEYRIMRRDGEWALLRGETVVTFDPNRYPAKGEPRWRTDCVVSVHTDKESATRARTDILRDALAG